ncbi:MAG: glycosyltransferase 61 family protein [Limnothrix sp. BL-A-16]
METALPRNFFFYNSLSIEDCLKLAQIFLDKGCPSEAVEFCRQAINLHPQSPKAYQLLGLAYQVWGSHPKLAESSYKKAIFLDSQNGDNYYLLATFYHELGLLDQAIEAYHQALEKRADCTSTHWGLGNLLYSQGDFTKSIRHHTKALKTSWNCPLISYDLLDLCKKGYAELSLSYALETIRRSPHHLSAANICYAAINKLIDQKDYSHAISLAIFCLQHQPSLPGLFDFLRTALEKLGREEDAASCSVGMIPLHVIFEFAVDAKKIVLTFLEKQPQNVVFYTCSNQQKIYAPPAQSIKPQYFHSMVGGVWEYAAQGIAFVDQGTVWSDPSTTAVLSSSQELIEDLSYGNSGLVASSNYLPEKQKFAGTLAVLSIRYSNNYCHWMFDFVARAGLLNQFGSGWDSFDAFLLDPIQSNFQAETIAALRIPESKIIQNSTGTHLQADRLIVPSPLKHWPVFDKATCALIKSLFLRNEDPEEIKSSLPKYLYLSRSEARYRRVLNDEQVQEFLKKLGFVSISLSKLSVYQQANLLAGAEVVVAPHGAGLTNLVFCQPGTKVLEIFPHRYRQQYYWALANQCGLIYQYLIGCSVSDYLASGGTYPFNDLEDIVVDIGDLLTSLTAMSVELPHGVHR